MLHELEIPHRYIEINPYKKQAHFLALNPRGLIPTLAISQTNPDIIQRQEYTQQVNSERLTSDRHNSNSDNDTSQKENVLYESTVIADYLDSIYDPYTSLYPVNPYERARSHLWINHITTRIIPAFYRFLQHTPEKSYTLSSTRDEFLDHLSTFVEEMHSPGPYFLNSGISMVDIALIPWACRLFLLDHYKTPEPGSVDSWTTTIPSSGAVWSRFKIWFDAIKERSSVRETLSERERYVDAYWRYAEDQTGSQVGRATREGRGMP